ncbi:MAG: excinuclease ABC subunit UvrC [Candidatus Saccharimonadales bacterium]
MDKALKDKLKTLPVSPGVYFHRSKSGEIIYVGKAANLKNRVRQYFQSSKNHDPKTIALVNEIVDVDWMVVDSEIEALFLEAEMIRRYMPRYNILLRDDKSMVYLRIDYDSDYPTVTITRRPLDDKARYFGPFLSVTSLNQALKFLRRAFPYATKKSPGQKRASLYYHIGLDPGLEEGRTSLNDYRANLRKLMAVISGRKKQIEKELRTEMNKAAKKQDYELAAKYRNQLSALENLNRQVIFSDKEFLDISKDHALNEMVKLFNLSKFPRTIEAYDISHMQGSDVVASMVVFTNGVSDKRKYRKFKMHINQNNDFYNMHETLFRRLKPVHLKSWGIPDLLLIDGGKGQLDSALTARDEMDLSYLPCIGLAKRQEQIVIHKTKSMVQINEAELSRLGGFKSEASDFVTIDLPLSTNLIKLLQRIRDESHRFAVSYHSVLKIKRQTSSRLEDIPGIGPATRRKLQKHFGGINAILVASESELSQTIGKAKARQVKQYLKN